jgi:hypothetical protein
MTPLDLSPADFRRFLTVLVDTSIGQPVLLEYGTDCEWHPSNQTLQCPGITIRCYPCSAGSWQIIPLTHYAKFCMFTLRLWVFKSGVLKKIFILSKHGTKANIRSTTMENNRHAYNRDVRVSTHLFNGTLFLL